ncbi:MAG: twin arginine-targeting protein translocase TatC [Nitrospinae bacterium RIFCSPLOWO2_01_FULL_39_10]|nr:MAG: twin arginine-targeting protein translocase TatC [Nitrospinae bacterium RIFCSPLOWO2_01_FULL_39_10]
MTLPLSDVINILERFKREFIEIASIVLIFSIFGYFLSSDVQFQFERLIGDKLAYFSPQEAFLTILKISFLTGLFLSFPLIFYKIWKVVSNKYGFKKRLTSLSVVTGGVMLFLSGAALCYFAVLPVGIKFLIGYETDYMVPYISIGKYINFCGGLILAFGLSFELPLVMLVLGRIGIINSYMLSKYRKYAILVIAIVSAIITPTPDAYSMMLMTVPLVILYEISILLVKIFGKR